MSRGRFLLAVALAAAVSAGGAFAALSLTAAARVPLAEKEWGIVPKPAPVKAGKVTFVVKNVGHLGHEFIVDRTSRAAAKLPLKGATAVVSGQVGKIPKFAPGTTKTLTLTLKPGHYVLLCNLPAHYQAGQRVDFTVR